MKLRYLVILLVLLMSCTDNMVSVENEGDNSITSNEMTFWVTQNQNTELTVLTQYHRNCFIDRGIISEFVWMAKGSGSFQILCAVDSVDNIIWESPIYNPHDIECEQEKLNIEFTNKHYFLIRNFDYKDNDLELYISGILK